MKNYLLKAKLREEKGKKNINLREKGLIPAVIYGKKVKSKKLVLDYLSFEKLFTEAGESNLIDLSIGKEAEAVKVIVKDVQYDPFTDKIIHADFKQINMKEKLHTYIPLEFIGESPAVREQGGILVKSIDELEIECLPADLISKIEVDLSPLDAFEKVIKISDIAVPEGLTVLNNPEVNVVIVKPPRSIKELEKLEEKPEEAVEEVKVEGEKKEDEEKIEKNKEEKK